MPCRLQSLSMSNGLVPGTEAPVADREGAQLYASSSLHVEGCQRRAQCQIWRLQQISSLKSSAAHWALVFRINPIVLSDRGLSRPYAPDGGMALPYL